MRFHEDDHFLAWQRYTEAANQEKEWMHQRLSWIFTTQGFLFAAFVAVLKVINDALNSQGVTQGPRDRLKLTH